MKRNAFTLLEMLLVIALISMLALAVQTTGAGFYSDWELENVRAKLKSDLMAARYSAFLNETSETFTVNENAYIRHDGKSVTMPNNVALVSPLIVSGSLEIVFDSLGGVSSGVTFEVKYGGTPRYEFAVNRLGRIKDDLK
ncbi:MAG: prepilin-type N-terminal cleavage/methylation domain-containing protein [Candidatus Wallbacteria bacterium]|nr:prepilin-type N-terminal cleavage/methylation domain-containing protein [Candidatus Wallbacteria bacterium]